MFTGIIEDIGKVVDVKIEGANTYLDIACKFTSELKVDQSLAHNGVCLTVVSILNNTYRVCAIKETLSKTNLHTLIPGSSVNLERCLKIGDRLDGHWVQGHVDKVVEVKSITEENGSWKISLPFSNADGLVVPRGSICLNGVSLTVANCNKEHIDVAIIPYTWENTTFHEIKRGDPVNVEYDILGKYIAHKSATTFESSSK